MKTIFLVFTFCILLFTQSFAQFRDGDVVFIQSAANAELYLAANNGAITQQTLVTVHTKTSANEDACKWKLERAGGDWFYLRNVKSNLMLDTKKADAKPGTALWLWPGNHSNGQKYKFHVFAKDPSLCLLENRLSADFRVDLNHSKPENGTRAIIGRLENGRRIQKWRIVPADERTAISSERNDYKYRVYIYDKHGARREYLNAPLIMFDPSRPGNGRYVQTKSVSYDNQGNLKVTTGATGKLDYAYLHADGNSISKFMAAPNGKNIGLFTLTDGKKLVIRVDYNGDGVIDHMEVYDAINGRVSHFVLENAEALQHYDEMLEGKNVFCMLGGLAGGDHPTAFGLGVPEKAIYQGCGDNGFISGYGVPSFDTSPRFEHPEDVMDNFCKATLANADQLNGNGFGSIVGEGVGEVLKEIGNTLMAEGAVLAGAGVAGAAISGGTSTVLVPAGGITAGIGGLVWLIGKVAEGIEEDPVYIPGVDTPTANFTDFCKNRSRTRQCYSLQSLENAVGKNDCQNPAERIGDLTQNRVPGLNLDDGINFSPSGGQGSGGGSSACPWRPYSPAAGQAPYCQNKMQHPDLGSIWARINEEQCNNPVAQPGPPGSQTCGTGTIGPSNARLQVAAADIISPGTTRFVDDLLEKVINPGMGLFGLDSYRPGLRQLEAAKSFGN